MPSPQPGGSEGKSSILSGEPDGSISLRDLGCSKECQLHRDWIWISGLSHGNIKLDGIEMSEKLILPPSAIPAHDMPKTISRAEVCSACQCSNFKDGEDTGECRIEPPKMQFIPLPSKLGAMVPTAIAAWPNVPRDGFCINGFRPRVN